MRQIKLKALALRARMENFLSESNPSKFSENSKTSRKTVTLVLTQFKRNNLESQLKAVMNQTYPPDKIFVFQNGNHVNVQDITNKYNVELVHSSYNTKYFGRFAFCLGLNSEKFIIMDDDIIPGPLCFERYLNEAAVLDGIVGGNGRFAFSNLNYSNLPKIADTGIREKSVQVDFVGHLWVVNRAHLMDMFSVEPCTFDTGEDMHLCFSSMLKSGTKSYVCAQTKFDEMSDITDNALAIDKNASFRSTPTDDRISVEKYFKTLGVKFVSEL